MSHNSAELFIALSFRSLRLTFAQSSVVRELDPIVGHCGPNTLLIPGRSSVEHLCEKGSRARRPILVGHRVMTLLSSCLEMTNMKGFCSIMKEVSSIAKISALHSCEGPCSPVCYVVLQRVLQLVVLLYRFTEFRNSDRRAPARAAGAAPAGPTCMARQQEMR